MVCRGLWSLGEVGGREDFSRSLAKDSLWLPLIGGIARGLGGIRIGSGLLGGWTCLRLGGGELGVGLFPRGLSGLRVARGDGLGLELAGMVDCCVSAFGVFFFRPNIVLRVGTAESLSDTRFSCELNAGDERNCFHLRSIVDAGPSYENAKASVPLRRGTLTSVKGSDGIGVADSETFFCFFLLLWLF